MQIMVIRRRYSKLEKEIERLKIDLKQIPDRIAVKHLLAEHEIVRLETERKMFTDGVKMICYRAETCLYNLIAPFFARNNDEGRAFLKSVFQQPADIIPDKEGRVMNVKFHTMSTSPCKSCSKTTMRCCEPGVICLPRDPDDVGLHCGMSRI